MHHAHPPESGLDIYLVICLRLPPNDRRGATFLSLTASYSRLLISGHHRIKVPARGITRTRSHARGGDAHGMRTVEQQDKRSPANRPLLLGATFYDAYWCSTIRSGVKSLNPMSWNRDFLDPLSWTSGEAGVKVIIRASCS